MRSERAARHTEVTGAGVTTGGWRVAWRRHDHDERRRTAWGLLADLAGAEATVTNPCPRCGGPHGPVTLTGVPFVATVSYAAGYAVVALADSARFQAVGVDAAAEPSAWGAPLDFTGVLPEGAGLRDWVRVEAVVKADRRGLAVDPGRVRIRDGGCRWRARIPGRWDRVRGVDLPGPPGVLVSLALIERSGSARERR